MRIGARQLAVVMLYAALPIVAAAGQDAASPPLAAREEAALRAAADRVADSVVQIRTIGGLDTAGPAALTMGPTTGLVISADGYILSSAFNFLQQPASILVTLRSGRQLPAEHVATDRSRMLVLLKAAGAVDLPVPEAVPAQEIRVGQWAVAVGRTYAADRNNVSVGIVSALDRMFGKVIQTDASTSTANYGGPLVDIRGRVFGVIVPLAPQGTSEVAGVEWYDSGIGFAVPLDTLSQRIEQLKQGTDLHAGVLGIGMLPSNPHSAAAELAAVRPDSPAGRAGLKKGDRIVEVDGAPIHTQTDLRFALGPRYGGDTVRVVARRGEERLERAITLAGELPAFKHAFLGVLPLRRPLETAAKVKQEAVAGKGDAAGESQATPADAQDTTDAQDDAEPGIGIRMVLAGCPAEAAGVLAGDRLVAINGVEVDSLRAALGEMNSLAPGSDVSLRIIRDKGELELHLTASQISAQVPQSLAPAYEAVVGAVDGDTPAAPAAGQTRDLKLPEFPQHCKIYVPAANGVDRAFGLLMWLQPPGQADAEAVIRDWQSLCDRDGLVMVVPSPADANRWERTEIEYLGRLTRHVLDEYTIDRQRVAVFGQGGGGAMAWLLALAGRDAFRGLATSAAPLPRQLRLPANEPNERLSIFAAIPFSNEPSALITQGLQKCADAGYPVITISLADATGQLSNADREQLARWIDSLDRF